MEGKLSISRPNDEFIRIELADKNSGLTVTKIEIPMEEFAMCITGLSRQSCDYNVFNNYDMLGKKKETKTELISIGDYPRDNFKDYMVNLIEELGLQIDGWKVDEYSIKSMNHHNLEWGKYRVSFYRYR